MRLYLELSANSRPVPFDYQHFLVGAFHKWLGNNSLHDHLSLYSLSWLSGGRCENNALQFRNGATWFVSAHDETLIRDLSDGVMRNPEVCCGMSVTAVRAQHTPQFQSYYAFKVGSPVLARSKEIEGKVTHFLYSDQEADDVLTQTLRHKLDFAGMKEQASSTRVRFDRSYRGAKTKLTTINGIHNRGSLCPIIVEGPPEAVQFAWNVGIGHLTGSGFGSLL